ncbi:MAG: hypothetical protein FJ149_04860 [Euryarchaeota archaeon]|nr:hypothetical protein [Euryarchaeota archaeon]
MEISDGIDSITHTLMLIALPGNFAPVITSTPVTNATVRISASDGRGGVAFQEFTVTVLDRIKALVQIVVPLEGQMDTTKLKNGRHILQARAHDGMDYSDIENRTITVDNQSSTPEGFIPGSSGTTGLAAAIIGLMLLARKRKIRK